MKKHESKLSLKSRQGKSKWQHGWRRLLHLDGDDTIENSGLIHFTDHWNHIRHSLSTSRPLGRSWSSNWYSSVLLNPRLISAPMVILSERSFRLLLRRHGVQLCYSPMILASELAEHGYSHCPYANELRIECSADRPIIAQLAGNDPEVMFCAGKMLERYVDGIDINLGCPQHCAEKENYGCYLLRNERSRNQVLSLVRSLSSRLSVPVTCKIRIFDDDDDNDDEPDENDGKNEVIDVEGRARQEGMKSLDPSSSSNPSSLSYSKLLSFCLSLEREGCSLLVVHGRRRSERDHQSPANYEVIRLLTSHLSIPVILNGNIRTMQDAEDAIKYTGCAGVMSGVGLLRNPYLFDQERMTPLISSLLDQHIDPILPSPHHILSPSNPEPLPLPTPPLSTLFPSPLSLSPSGTLLNALTVSLLALEYLEICTPPSLRFESSHHKMRMGMGIGIETENPFDSDVFVSSDMHDLPLPHSPPAQERCARDHLLTWMQEFCYSPSRINLDIWYFLTKSGPVLTLDQNREIVMLMANRWFQDQISHLNTPPPPTTTHHHQNSSSHPSCSSSSESSPNDDRQGPRSPPTPSPSPLNPPSSSFCLFPHAKKSIREIKQMTRWQSHSDHYSSSLDLFPSSSSLDYLVSSQPFSS